ncbi:ABC transporter permease [Marinomonas pollencensis]|uniref:Arginine ABC transporter permease protein ArtM n=1 Tax=Marinomonas pollencensis TaxID=491954 RepID=A0A3E0DJ99_9GAMM|nr:ABC transporter permease [Marinomonas pollencensis]REG82173.1 amino acid ABC transporter membrane protein 2 (PAAT family) [Marinomonas pollencensis]
MEKINWLDWGVIDWNLPLNHWDLFIVGTFNTVLLTILALFVGWVLSIPLAFLRANRNKLFNYPILCFTYVFRGTPLLIQLFLIYYGAGQFDIIKESVFWVILKDPWWCAFIAFSLNSAAYQTEILRGAIETMPQGENEVAVSMGMPVLLRLRRIILPSATRRALPMYSNEIIFMLHGSVIASTITILDILKAGRMVNGQYYVAYEGFITAAVIYMALVFITTKGLKRLEGNWNAYKQPRTT